MNPSILKVNLSGQNRKAQKQNKIIKEEKQMARQFF